MAGFVSKLLHFGSVKVRAFIDRHSVSLKEIVTPWPPDPDSTRLNLGSGLVKPQGYINIDIRPEVEPDVVCDISEGMPFPTGSIAVVRAFDVLEHVPTGKTVGAVEEIWRVLKPGGILQHCTPSTDGRGAFQDPTHRSFWNENSWLYFMDDELRRLYGIKARFTGKNITIKTDRLKGIVYVYGLLKAVK